MPARASPQHRSGCPVSRSLEIFGDRWSLLIIRDLMIRGLRNFKDFQHSGEGIASNILPTVCASSRRRGSSRGEAERTGGASTIG